MAQTISDTILDHARKIAQGDDLRAQLSEQIQQALPATEEQIESFHQHAPNNPEFTPEMVTEFGAGLARLRDCFQDIQDSLDDPPGSAWSALADSLQEAILEVRKAQAVHHERIEDGDTSHLFLNRLLIHLDAWQKGRSPGAMTRALVEAVPHFENELRSFIEEFEDSGVQEQMSEHLDLLMETCSAVVEAVVAGKASPTELAQWQSKIVQFSQDLDQTLAETVESHLALGPTPFPIVNLVNAAMDRYLGQLIPAEDLADTTEQCEDWLRLQLPAETDPSLAEAAEGLFAVLQEMKRTCLETGDHDTLISQRENLFAAAENLAMFAAVLSPEDQVVNLVSTEGLAGGASGDNGTPMPALLATILQQADAYLSGSQNSDGLEESVQSLERLVTATQGQMSRSRDAQAVKERTQQALAILEEATQQLWDFIDNPKSEALDSIEEQIVEASEVVASLSPRRR